MARSLPSPILQMGKLSHTVRLADFLEVTELVSGGLGLKPQFPGSQSHWLSGTCGVGNIRDDHRAPRGVPPGVGPERS